MSSLPVTLLRPFNNGKSLDFLADMPRIFADWQLQIVAVWLQFWHSC